MARPIQAAIVGNASGATTTNIVPLAPGGKEEEAVHRLKFVSLENAAGGGGGGPPVLVSLELGRFGASTNLARGFIRDGGFGATPSMGESLTWQGDFEVFEDAEFVVIVDNRTGFSVDIIMEYVVE